MMYEYWFANIHGISSGKKRKLRERIGNAEGIYNIEETVLSKLDFLKEEELEILRRSRKMSSPKADYQKLQEAKIQFVPYFDNDYPKKLHEIHNPPYALYVRGRLPNEQCPSVAIVGARRCSTYGESMALEYGKILALAGVQVISGLAKGIDGAGHRGALNGKGSTFGVLGCGVDICYPRDNIGLYMDMQKQGGIISEQNMGVPPLARFFPQRNRIISGLADVVLIIEAKEKSGSLITADLALEQGRDIYALPGPVTSALSRGCHRLIAQGAGILITPEELLKELGVRKAERTAESDKNEKVLETTEKLVYSCLDLFPKSVGELSDATHLPINRLMEALTSLEIDGFIKEIAKNYYIRVRC